MGDGRMRPAKLSANVFLELPPVLTHYVENVRNLWIEGNPKQGKLSLLSRQGVFSDIESLAVARRQLIEVLGLERARALCYRIGFEQGRRDAARHLRVFGQNARLTLQGGPVFRQLQGRGIATSVKFEFDLDTRTLYRELTLRDSTEAMAHRVAVQANEDCACWTTAGYLSGHVSEILGRRVVTLETSCGARGDELCRFVSRFDPEWGNEVHWVRKALDMPSVDSELAEREAVAAKAQTMARRAQGRLNDLNRRLRSDLIAASVVADSPVMEPVMALVRRAMASEAPVLFVGERGVGCETLAQAIHYGSKRKAKPLITVDCKGLPEPMLLQELIGFNKGAFAGAVRGHTGALVRANGGTLYLNDISRLSVETQGHLLTALEESQVRPIGADKPTKTDIRLIGATREDPKDLLASGALREAFFYALAVLPIPRAPAARARRRHPGTGRVVPRRVR